MSWLCDCRCCCACLDRYTCTSSRKSQKELRVFDAQPLLAAPHRPTRLRDIYTPESITTLFYQTLKHEFECDNRLRQAHILGPDSSSTCMFCDKHALVQFEIDNVYFGNAWNANQYITGHLCKSCAKEFKIKLTEVVSRFYVHVEDVYRDLLSQCMRPHNLPWAVGSALQTRILAFLPLRSFLLVKEFHNGSVKEDQAIR